MPWHVLSNRSCWMRQPMQLWPKPRSVEVYHTKRFCQTTVIGRAVLLAKYFFRNEFIFACFVQHSDSVHFFIHGIEIHLHQKNCVEFWDKLHPQKNFQHNQKTIWPPLQCYAFFKSQQDSQGLELEDVVTICPRNIMPTSEVQSKMILMGHQILSCHLPCPGSEVIFHLVEDVVIILKSSIWSPS